VRAVLVSSNLSGRSDAGDRGAEFRARTSPRRIVCVQHSPGRCRPLSNRKAICHVLNRKCAARRRGPFSGHVSTSGSARPRARFVPVLFSKIEGAAGDVAGLTPTVTAFRGLLGEPTTEATRRPPPAAGKSMGRGRRTRSCRPRTCSPRTSSTPTCARCRVRVEEQQVPSERRRRQPDQHGVSGSRTSTVQYDTSLRRSVRRSCSRRFAPTWVASASSCRARIPRPPSRVFGAVFTDVDRSGAHQARVPRPVRQGESSRRSRRGCPGQQETLISWAWRRTLDIWGSAHYTPAGTRASCRAGTSTAGSDDLVVMERLPVTPSRPAIKQVGRPGHTYPSPPGLDRPALVVSGRSRCPLLTSTQFLGTWATLLAWGGRHMPPMP
jgi:hypothetical protein